MNRLEELRRASNLTQVEAATAMNVTQGTISQWENGRSFPRPNRLPALARLYRCSIEALYEPEEETTLFEKAGAS